MLRTNFFCVLTFLVMNTLCGQSLFNSKLEGRISSTTKDVEGVHVRNISQKKAVITDAKGFFSITAKVNDTIVFSAIQFKKKEIVLSNEMLDATSLIVHMEEAMNKLDEVVVTPYNLSGELGKDLKTLEIDPVVSASTLGLPNAGKKKLIQSERLLREAAMPKFNMAMLTAIPFNPLINAITGRTKMLKERVARDKKYLMSQEVQKTFTDSTFLKTLKIPKDKMDDFMYFCEVDSTFETTVKSKDQLKIWEFLRKKSEVYRSNNAID